MVTSCGDLRIVQHTLDVQDGDLVFNIAAPVEEEDAA